MTNLLIVVFIAGCLAGCGQLCDTETDKTEYIDGEYRHIEQCKEEKKYFIDD